MRIHGQTGPAGAIARVVSPKGAGNGAFTLSQPVTGNASGVLAATRTVALDTTLAVQDRAAAQERRRRAVRRGNSLLDRLEELRACLLEGGIEPALLRRLHQELAAPPEMEDVDLRSVMSEIELRATVEIAKLEAAR